MFSQPYCSLNRNTNERKICFEVVVCQNSGIYQFVYALIDLHEDVNIGGCKFPQVILNLYVLWKVLQWYFRILATIHWCHKEVFCDVCGHEPSIIRTGEALTVHSYSNAVLL